MGILEGPNNGILRSDSRVQAALEALADHVDHGGLSPVIKSVAVDGMVFGYRLEDHLLFMRRQVFVKVPGWKIADISEDERARVMMAIFNVFVLPGGKKPVIRPISKDCLYFEHDFIPEIAVERLPGLVSIAGGFDV